MDPLSVRRAEVLNINLLPKILEPVKMHNKWNDLKILDIKSVKEFQEVITTQLYQNASDNHNAEWRMQLCKTLASKLWKKEEKIVKPDPSVEVVFLTVENHIGYDLICCMIQMEKWRDTDLLSKKKMLSRKVLLSDLIIIKAQWASTIIIRNTKQ